MKIYQFYEMTKGHLCGLVSSALDHYHLYSTLGVGISEGCLNFAS